MCILFRLMKMQSKLKELIGSEFNHHEDAEAIVKTFTSVHGELDYVHNLAQISMDGQNINW